MLEFVYLKKNQQIIDFCCLATKRCGVVRVRDVFVWWQCERGGQWTAVGAGRGRRRGHAGWVAPAPPAPKVIRQLGRRTHRWGSTSHCSSCVPYFWGCCALPLLSFALPELPSTPPDLHSALPGLKKKKTFFAYDFCFCVFRQPMNCKLLADLCPCFHQLPTKLCPDLVSFACWIVPKFWAFACKSL